MSNYSYSSHMNNSFLYVTVAVFLIQITRYMGVAGFAYYYFWIRNKEKYLPSKIQPQPYERQRVKKEVLNSALFSLISAFAFALPFWEPLAPYSKLYTEASEHSLLWLLLTVPALIVIQDTYFYWMHRLVHHPKLYSFIHREHHESRDPSPFAAYSFHWSEGILEVAWFIPLMFVIPMHHGTLYAFGMISLLFNVNGHLGVDLYPRSWATHPVFQWLNTSTAHNNHHKYFKGNYGFYFNFWDRIMKTQTKLPSKINTAKVA